MKMISWMVISFLVASGLILSACAANGPTDTLAGTFWKLVSYGKAENQTPAAPGIEKSLDFGSDGKVKGNVGCNQFSGNYELKNGKIDFGKLVSTLMACPEPQMTQERMVFQVMAGTASAEIRGNSLTISDASGANSIKLLSVNNK